MTEQKKFQKLMVKCGKKNKKKEERKSGKGRVESVSCPCCFDNSVTYLASMFVSYLASHQMTNPSERQPAWRSATSQVALMRQKQIPWSGRLAGGVRSLQFWGIFFRWGEGCILFIISGSSCLHAVYVNLCQKNRRLQLLPPPIFTGWVA